MNSEWNEVSLDSLKSNTKSAFAMGPFGSKIKAENFVSTGVPVIKGGNLGGTYLDERNFDFLTPQKAEELSSSKARRLDIVVTHRGTLGQVGLIPESSRYEQYIVSQSQLKMSFDSAKADPYFIYYFLRSPIGQTRLLANTSQVGVPAIAQALTTVRHILIPLPSKKLQNATSAILRSLDDRITLLRETNATLEAIAQAIFKSWFVDFDPVRAKMEGRAPEGMDEATAALFPGSFEESELGQVPKGWSYVSLREVVSIFDSKRVPLSGQDRAKRQGPYPYYGAAALMDSVDDYLFNGVYLLTGEDGSVADAQGYPITQYVWGKIWVNNHAHVLQGKNGVSTEHVMLSLRQTNILPYVTGAVQAKLSQSNMWRIMFMMPSQDVSEAFGSMIEPLYARLRQNSEQAQTLTSLRDTLLPRLISGKLRLSEAENTIAEAIA